MRVVGRIVVLILCVVLASITVPKLYTMSAIKGWVPGAKVQIYHVTQKLDNGKVYWISWTRDDIRLPGNHKSNIRYERWAKLKIGDPIEIITVGNDPTTYTRDDIFVEPGNFVFDLVLLAGELAGIILVIRGFLRKRRAV